jgi:hypothetical protein
MSNRCEQWPGWRCTRPAGHDGPCPLWPRWWNLRARYQTWKAIR